LWDWRKGPIVTLIIPVTAEILDKGDFHSWAIYPGFTSAASFAVFWRLRYCALLAIYEDSFSLYALHHVLKVSMFEHRVGDPCWR
jgi:hypothetical protein